MANRSVIRRYRRRDDTYPPARLASRKTKMHATERKDAFRIAMVELVIEQIKTVGITPEEGGSSVRRGSKDRTRSPRLEAVP